MRDKADHALCITFTNDANVSENVWEEVNYSAIASITFCKSFFTAFITFHLPLGILKAKFRYMSGFRIRIRRIRMFLAWPARIRIRIRAKR